MVLSLSHLASGIELITGDRDGWQSWMMAVVVDAGFVALELGMIFAHLERSKKIVLKYAKPTIFVLMLGSAALNALAFGAQAQGLTVDGAVVLGIVVPVLVYVLTKCGGCTLDTLKGVMRSAAATFNIGVAALARLYGQWLLGVIFLLIGLVFLYFAIAD